MGELEITRDARARLESILRRARHAQNAVRSRAQLEHADAYLEAVVRELESLIAGATVSDPSPRARKPRD